MSISSVKQIQKRTLEFCKTINKWCSTNKLFNKINKILNTEYRKIPERERIGKGIKFISNQVAKGVFQCLKKGGKTDIKFIINFIGSGFNYGESEESSIMQHFVLHLIAEYISSYPEKFDDLLPLIINYACYSDWAIRETTTDSIISGLKRIPEKTIELLSDWTKSNNENLRRIVSESLRPHSSIKWLRDPAKNDRILEILTILRKDPSIYVRKSVGNNLKDLSKYMPETILDLVETWINKAQIRVHDELANEKGLDREEKRLIWTIKHGMRWVKNRNPEFHSRLEKILGKNYVLYFDEKRNRLAKPFKKD